MKVEPRNLTFKEWAIVIPLLIVLLSPWWFGPAMFIKELLS